METTNRTPVTPAVRVGGQAVIDGVMMRAGDRICVAVRRPDGAIETRTSTSRGRAHALRRIPLVRGIAALGESMVAGVEALRWSELRSLAPDDERRPAPTWALLGIALTGVVGLVVVVPALVAGLVPGSSDLGLVETGARLLLAGGYVALVARREDVRRVFQYHGAEHLVVGAHEAGRPLTPTSTRAGSIHHPRCGTSFLLVISAVAAVVHPLLPDDPVPSRLLARLVVIPLVAAVAYEVLTVMGRWAAAHPGGLVEAALLWPQRFTTREPDDAQIEVAIAALHGALGDEVPDATDAPALVGASS